MLRPIVLTLAGLALAMGIPAQAAPEAKVRVERVAGAPVSADRLIAIDENGVTLSAGAANAKIPLADVIEIAFATSPDPPQAWPASVIAADMTSGETLYGEIKSGDQHGFTLASPLLGDVAVSIDRLLAVRFLKRLSLLPEPPDLRAPESMDMVHLTGADRLACTIEAFSAKAVAVESSSGEKVVVAYDRVTAIRVNAEPAKRPAGTLFVAVLRDGSQIIGSSPLAAEGRLKMKSLSGFAVDASLADVVAAHVVSDRFVYLSDLPGAQTEVTPFWKTVAGDPAVLYAPRLDRSFTGRALRSGGRTWVKGIGVYSGTSMTFPLGGKFSEFRASAGIDDGAGPLGAVVFEVLVDGQSKWTSGLVRGASADGRGKPSPVQLPHLDVKGAKSLTLRVLPGDAEDPWPVADEADWLGAMLVR